MLTTRADPSVKAIEAPVNANIWKILLKEGDLLQEETITCILEAMKMEINVYPEADQVGSTVFKVLVQPGDSIESGDPVFLVKSPKT